MQEPIDDFGEGEIEEICSVCGDEEWLCDECFHEIVSIGDMD